MNLIYKILLNPFHFYKPLDNYYVNNNLNLIKNIDSLYDDNYIVIFFHSLGHKSFVFLSDSFGPNQIDG